MSQKDEKGRTIVRQPQVMRATRATTIVTTKKVLEDALNIVNEQVELLAMKSRQGTSALLPEEVKALHGHIKALVDIDRNEREALKADPNAKELEELSDAELLELYKQKKGLQEPTGG